MKKRSVLIILVVTAVAAFFGGYLASRPSSDSSSGKRKILYYVDPMHPAYKSDKPGIAPDCGMQLEPVYADGGPAGGADTPPAGLPPGVIRVSADRQQLIGVRTAVVEKGPVSHTLRVLGKVAADETRVYRIIASLQGYVKWVSPVTTGTFVEKNQLLAKLYSPELYPLINSYIFSLNSIDRQNKDKSSEFKEKLRNNINVRAQRSNLFNTGMSEIQLEEIMDTRYNREEIDVRAVASGIVLARNLSLGERFERGAEFYRVGDLTRVWIVADIFESEGASFKPGTPVTCTLPYLNKTFTARISQVRPLFDAATRTLKVRLEADNPGSVMRPDMFVTVELPMSLPEMITAPSEAVLDSGLKKTVFVDRGNGWFEPRQVETGRRVGDRVEIVKGLTPGEKIVVSGNFLLDSESRLKNAAAGIFGTPGKDPVCGMALDEERAKAAGFTRQFGGKTYYFCGPEDMAKFDKAPKRYTGPNAVVEPMTMPHPSASGSMKMEHGTATMPMTKEPAKMQKMPGMKDAPDEKNAAPMPGKQGSGVGMNGMKSGTAPGKETPSVPKDRVPIPESEELEAGTEDMQEHPPATGAVPHDK